MDAPVLGFEEALRLMADHAAGVVAVQDVEEVELLAAQGRVLAGEVVADRDQPPFDRSTRDGFAVRAGEFGGGVLKVIGQVRAGEVWSGAAPGACETIEIMTGAPMPAGADAVAMVEHVERRDGTIRAVVGRSVRAGENIVPRGSEARVGQRVLAAGTAVGAAEIALAASCGRATLSVLRRARVAIVATGDELVELDEPLAEHQIRNSNSYALAALVAAAGGEAVRLPIARDEREAVRQAIEAGRRADLLVLSGGVSMGQYDLVEEVLRELGAEFFFTGVRMQPGKPVVFGRLPATEEFAAVSFFGLPGNPISTQVTFHVFVAPLLRAMGGSDVGAPQFVQAILAEDVAGKPGLTRLLPARLEGVEVRVVPWQGSGDLAANARANCYVLLPEGRDRFTAGEAVRILLR